MGQPIQLKAGYFPGDRKGQTLGTETSKYQEEEKTNSDFQSSGERNGKSPNLVCFGIRGVIGLPFINNNEAERSGNSDQRW